MVKEKTDERIFSVPFDIAVTWDGGFHEIPDHFWRNERIMA